MGGESDVLCRQSSIESGWWWTWWKYWPWERTWECLLRRRAICLRTQWWLLRRRAILRRRTERWGVLPTRLLFQQRGAWSEQLRVCGGTWTPGWLRVRRIWSKWRIRLRLRQQQWRLLQSRMVTNVKEFLVVVSSVLFGTYTLKRKKKDRI